jgi:hypothetical protein
MSSNTAAVAFSTPNIAMLTGKQNWSFWKDDMGMVLIKQGLWRIVDPERPLLIFAESDVAKKKALKA